MIDKNHLIRLGLNPSDAFMTKLHEENAKVDQLILKVLLLHWALSSTLMGIAQGSYLIGVVGGALLCATAWVAHKVLPSGAHTHVISACIALFSGLFIMQSAGDALVHLHIFVVLALLSRYKSSIPIKVAVSTHLVGLVLLGLMQTFGVELFSMPIAAFSQGLSWSGGTLYSLGLAFMTWTLIGHVNTTLRDTQVQSSDAHVAIQAIEAHLDRRSPAPVDNSAYSDTITRVHKLATRDVELSASLEKANLALMMVTKEGCIAETNEEARKLFAHLSPCIKNAGLALNAHALQGEDILPLFRHAQLNLDLHHFGQRTSQELTIGKHRMRLSATPLTNDQGERLGAMIDWVDVSDQTAIQGQVQEIVTAARNGDLSRRIELMEKQGFYAELSSDINDLIGVCDQVINDTVFVLAAMSDGDLTRQIEGDYKGKFATLKGDANSTLSKLTSVVNDIQQSATALSGAANELAQTNNGLAQRTEEQAAGIEQTAATLEQMTASVKQSADHAQLANSSASQVREQIMQSQSIVGETIEAMGSINEASNKILSIIGLINDLSFQTNLLALNAAVEAARAGEQGRGFAVVATEVRNLAERSANAAKDIKHLIEDSAAQVKQGTEFVNRSSEAMAGVVTSVAGVTEIIQEIALASQEQANGIGQINQALARLEATTQQNASMVNQTRSASEQTGEQAQQLNEMIAFFTVSR